MDPVIAQLIIVLAAAAPFLALCIMRRDLALAVFCGLLPAYLVRFAVPLPGIGMLPSTLLEVLFWELFLTWLFIDGVKPGAWKGLAAWAEPITLLFVGATIGVLVSPDPRAGLGLWRAYILEPILFLPLFVDVVTRRKRGVGPLIGFGAAVAAVGVTAIYQKMTGFGIPNPVWQAEETRRVTSIYGFPNAIALFAAPITVLMSGWALARWRAKDAATKASAALPAIAAALGAAAMLFAVSEGGLLAAAAGLVALLLIDRKLRPWGLALIIAGCVAVVAVKPLTDYASLIASLRDDSGAVRRIVWKESLDMLSDETVFGAGLSGYRTRLEPYHTATHIEIFMYPHNLFLNFWTETGLLGLIGFLWILYRFFSRAAELARKKAGGWLVPALAAAMVTVVVHGLVDVPYFKNDLAFLFWALVGLLEAMRILSDTPLEEVKRALHLPPPQWML